MGRVHGEVPSINTQNSGATEDPPQDQLCGIDEVINSLFIMRKNSDNSDPIVVQIDRTSITLFYQN